MTNPLRSFTQLLALVGAASVLTRTIAQAQIPAFAPVSHVSPAKGEQTAVFAGGCFWGVDAVFKHVKGVSNVVSGYSGGGPATARYGVVSTGTTGHAESVQITYDPSQISYSELLRVFFSVAHDPTQLNRQGPDVGSQYRSAIFYENQVEQETAQAYIDQLNKAHVFSGPIVTQVAPFEHFYPAEDYHQNYLALHPDQPYIVFNDAPKLRRLKEQFPALYRR
ncbi:MAG: peptide-methionine (S)-S-oxide reductase [Gemmatimonadetes bacterium]|nr:MAG: peptide-methionine (S)-S-oxide reductase [Gemmatimonadota bacterium]